MLRTLLLRQHSSRLELHCLPEHSARLKESTTQLMDTDSGDSTRLRIQLENRPPCNLGQESLTSCFLGEYFYYQLEYKQERDRILWCLQIERTVSHQQPAQFICAYEVK